MAAATIFSSNLTNSPMFVVGNKTCIYNFYKMLSTVAAINIVKFGVVK